MRLALPVGALAQLFRARFVRTRGVCSVGMLRQQRHELIAPGTFRVVQVQARQSIELQRRAEHEVGAVQQVPQHAVGEHRAALQQLAVPLPLRERLVHRLQMGLQARQRIACGCRQIGALIREVAI